VAKFLTVLQNVYADRHGEKPVLNDAQRALWMDLLSPFDAQAVESASKAWMRGNAFFPRPSDIVKILRPVRDLDAEAHRAWAAVERAIPAAGRYAGVTFADGVIGECVRQTFGSWSQACSFEFDSPGWAIRRQTFLAIYPHIASVPRKAITLRGEHPRAVPYLFGHVDGLPTPCDVPELQGDQPLSREEAQGALAALTNELKARGLKS